MPLLEKALIIAVTAHDGQLDKQAQPYILHVLRVVLGCTTPDAQVVAALHDVLEDTDFPIPWAEMGLEDTPIQSAVILLTRSPEEDYQNYIAALALHPLAKEVKISDLKDNLGRIDGLDLETRLRLRSRYERALLTLTTDPLVQEVMNRCLEVGKIYGHRMTQPWRIDSRTVGERKGLRTGCHDCSAWADVYYPGETSTYPGHWGPKLTMPCGHSDKKG